MKVIFVFLAVVLVVQAFTDEEQKLIENGRICRTKTGVNEKEIAKVALGDYSSIDPLLNDFTVCILKRVKIFDENENFARETTIANVKESEREAVTKAIDVCLNKLGEFVPRNAFEFLRCFYQEKPDYSLIS